MSSSEMPCYFCKNKLSRYSCPKCSASFCGIECYNCERHIKCIKGLKSTFDVVRYDIDSNSPTQSETVLNIEDDDVGNDDQDEQDYISVTIGNLDTLVTDIQLNGQLDQLGISYNTPEELLSCLNEEQIKDFEELIGNVYEEQSDNGEFDCIEDIKPWWTPYSGKIMEVESDNLQSPKGPRFPNLDHVLVVLNAPVKLPSSIAACVQYHLVHVVASYVYLVQSDRLCRCLAQPSTSQACDVAMTSFDYLSRIAGHVLVPHKNGNPGINNVSVALHGVWNLIEVNFHPKSSDYKMQCLRDVQTLLTRTATQPNTGKDYPLVYFALEEMLSVVSNVSHCEALLRSTNRKADAKKRFAKMAIKKIEFFIAYFNAHICSNKYERLTLLLLELHEFAALIGTELVDFNETVTKMHQSRIDANCDSSFAGVRL